MHIVHTYEIFLFSYSYYCTLEIKEWLPDSASNHLKMPLKASSVTDARHSQSQDQMVSKKIDTVVLTNLTNFVRFVRNFIVVDHWLERILIHWLIKF